MSDLLTAVAAPVLAPVGQRVADLAFAGTAIPAELDGRWRLQAERSAWVEEQARSNEPAWTWLVGGFIAGAMVRLLRR